MIWWRYLFPFVWTNFRSTFDALIEIFPKNVFWRQQVLLHIYLSVPFLLTEIRSHSMSSHDYTADEWSNRCFACSKMLFLSWWELALSYRIIIFLISWKIIKRKWLCNTQNLLFCVVLISIGFKKTDDGLRVYVSSANNLCWIWLILRYPYRRLLLTFRLIRVNSWFINCRVVIDVFRSLRIVFFEDFLRPIGTSPF